VNALNNIIKKTKTKNMQKIFYYLFGISTCITGAMGIYYLINPSAAPSLGTIAALVLECIVSFILCIMLEPRPRETHSQIKHDDKIKTQGITTILLIVVAVAIVILASSCSSSRKYGCGGGVNKRMTWEKMERRINRP
jgi:hypothetical protein